MPSTTMDRVSSRWRTIAIVLALALGATLGSAITVFAQSRGADDEPTVTTQRDTTPLTADDLGDHQVTELGGPDAVGAALADTAALDGTFASGQGTYVARASQCVLFDTRAEARLAPGSTTTFSTAGGENVGGESGCTVPNDALSAHVNLVAIGPASAGNLKIYGAALPTEPDGGIVNFQDLDPNMNNSNAFVVANDPTGWKVTVNGGGAHVRAVLMGWFLDGGDVYAAASHDHQVVQATGGFEFMSNGTTKTLREVDLTMARECSFGLTERHRALVTYSGEAWPYSDGAAMEFQLWVDDTRETAADRKIVFDTGSQGRIPISRTFLVEGLGWGTHTFEVRVDNHGPSAADVDADIVVEHRGWTCQR